MSLRFGPEVEPIWCIFARFSIGTSGDCHQIGGIVPEVEQDKGLGPVQPLHPSVLPALEEKLRRSRPFPSVRPLACHLPI